jgi:flagellin
MEHAAKGLMTAYENVQASESRIRDADMAETMVDFTKNQILVQSGTAMLAQANTQPQGVLQLLR